MKEQQDRIEVLDFLRGVASLAVAVLHLTNVLRPDGITRAVTSYGWLGVEVFFVISGFIIPYSLYKGGYELRRFPVFVLKRVARLDPPYIATIVIILLLGVVSWYVPGMSNGVFQVTFAQVMLHLGYLNAFFHYEWLADVFWTLAIEFQYYVLIGLTYPLVVSRTPAVRYGTMAALGAMAFVVTGGEFVFYYIFLFLAGITVFQYRAGLIGKGECAALLAVILPLCYVRTEFAVAAAGAFAALSILFLRWRNRLFVFLGSISYSLYLMHSPVGRRGLNVALKLTHAESEPAKMLCVLFGLGVSIAAAYVLYRLVELPSQKLSSMIRYDRARAPRRGAADAAAREKEDEQLNPAF